MLSPGAVRQNFYSAEVNIFSPFGQWACLAFDPDIYGVCEDYEYNPTTVFCVDNRPGIISDGVELVLNSDFTITSVNNEPPPCSDGGVAAAFLGDSNATDQLDVDQFRLTRRGGGKVRVTLDRDGARGSKGEMARLVVRADNGSVVASRRGALPLVLETTLPPAENWLIEVAEVRSGPGGEALRGHYRLGLTSASDRPVQLEPLSSVEP
jgi:hypothetical protein